MHAYLITLIVGIIQLVSAIFTLLVEEFYKRFFCIMILILCLVYDSVINMPFFDLPKNYEMGSIQICCNIALAGALLMLVGIRDYSN